MQLGDEVTWTSQANGGVKTKTGKVVLILRAGERMPPMIEVNGLQLPAPARTGGGQRFDAESYVVHVPTPSGRGKGRLYWPRTSALVGGVKKGRAK